MLKNFSFPCMKIVGKLKISPNVEKFQISDFRSGKVRTVSLRKKSLPVHTNKVNRCLAIYSPRAITNNQPTNRAPKESARPCPKWPKMPISGKIWSFWGQKTNFFTGGSKSLGTHLTEKPPMHLVRTLFCLAWDQMGQNANIWPKIPFLGQIWLFFGPKFLIFAGVSKSFGIHIMEKGCDTFSLWMYTSLKNCGHADLLWNNCV